MNRKNSVNFSKHLGFLSSNVFTDNMEADQKISLLPEWASTENIAEDYKDDRGLTRGRDSGKHPVESKVFKQMGANQRRKIDERNRQNDRELDVPPIQENGKIKLVLMT